MNYSSDNLPEVGVMAKALGDKSSQMNSFVPPFQIKKTFSIISTDSENNSSGLKPMGVVERENVQRVW